MKDKDIKDLIDWLGYQYLDFDNESAQYVESVKEEIKDKINSYEK